LYEKATLLYCQLSVKLYLFIVTGQTQSVQVFSNLQKLLHFFYTSGWSIFRKVKLSCLT